MSITIRTALEDDFPAMCTVDLEANATHPVYTIPWKAAGPGALKAFILDRYRHLHHSRNPDYTFLIAMAGDDLVGYLFYHKPPREGEVEEWSPSFPNGTNLEFLEKVIREVKAAKRQYDLREFWRTCFYFKSCALKWYFLAIEIDGERRTRGVCGSSKLAA
jgi:hypothetical protein